MVSGFDLLGGGIPDVDSGTSVIKTNVLPIPAFSTGTSNSNAVYDILFNGVNHVAIQYAAGYMAILNLRTNEIKEIRNYNGLTGNVQGAALRILKAIDGFYYGHYQGVVCKFDYDFNLVGSINLNNTSALFTMVKDRILTQTNLTSPIRIYDKNLNLISEYTPPTSHSIQTSFVGHNIVLLRYANANSNYFFNPITLELVNAGSLGGYVMTRETPLHYMNNNYIFSKETKTQVFYAAGGMFVGLGTPGSTTANGGGRPSGITATELFLRDGNVLDLATLQITRKIYESNILFDASTLQDGYILGINATPIGQYTDVSKISKFIDMKGEVWE